jgi:Methyltransferase domain
MSINKNFLDPYFEGFKKFFPDLTIDQLDAIVTQSKYGGYPEEPGGSVWSSEGKAIYCFIRLLKPKKILEIGNFLGRSSNHILQAVADNGFGEVTLLDIEERLEYNRLHNRSFTRVLQDSLIFLEKEKLDFDLYVQDGCHEYAHVTKELELLTTRTDGDFHIWSHDWFTIRPPQCEVQRAWNDHVTKFDIVAPMKDSVSNCGFVMAHYKKQ